MSYDAGVAQLAPLCVAVAIFASALLVPLGHFLPRVVRDGVSAIVAATITVMDVIILVATWSGRVVSWIGKWTPHHSFSVGIVMVADPVGASLAVLTGVLVTCSLIFTWRYLPSVGAHYHSLVLLFLAGLEGFLLTGDLFDMFVFFELMGAAAYALTALEIEDPTPLQGSLNFGIVNSLGAYLSLVGLAMLYARTGSVGLPQLGHSLAGDHASVFIVAAFVLVLAGFLVKGAVVPFHFWLADAHAVAPAPICLLFSGIMVPSGIYAVYRVYWIVFSRVLPGVDVSRAFLVVGVLTAVIGSVMSLGQRHIKRMLAYSTVAHVGLFVCAFSLLSASGTAGALLYIVGHAGAKGALFLLAGVLLAKYGSVDEQDLMGAAKGEWLLATLWMIAGLALAGLPPFGTALGKAAAESAGGQSGYWFFVPLFVLVSSLTGGAVLRVGGRVFFGLGHRIKDNASQSTGREEAERINGLPLSMVVPIVALLLGCLVLGVVPESASAAQRAGAYFVDSPGYIAAALHHVADRVSAVRESNWDMGNVLLGLLSALLAVAVAAGALLGGPAMEKVSRLRDALVHGYDALHRLHSGHVGDYVAWLMVGLSLILVVLGIPLLH